MNRILIVVMCLAPAAWGQQATLTCNEGHWREQGHYCEMRETTMAASSHLEVDGGMNGGISIKGASRSDILVRAKVEAYEDNAAESQRIAAAIHVDTRGGTVRASGPAFEQHGWGVSYEIFVPQNMNLVLRTHNGGIEIADVKGRMEFHAVNGGVSLANLAGSVEGHTTNGGVNLELASDHWDGDRCDVSTTNGGVTIRVPSGYSAHLETSTVNGGLSVDFPVTSQGDVSRRLDVNLGSGGKLVRATTTNGGVRIEKI